MFDLRATFACCHQSQAPLVHTPNTSSKMIQSNLGMSWKVNSQRPIADIRDEVVESNVIIAPFKISRIFHLVSHFDL